MIDEGYRKNNPKPKWDFKKGLPQGLELEKTVSIK
jgi:hypothetical protein